MIRRTVATTVWLVLLATIVGSAPGAEAQRGQSPFSSATQFGNAGSMTTKTGTVPLPDEPPRSSWRDTRVLGPFVFRADFPLDEVEPLLGELVRLQRDLGDLLGVGPPREAIHVYLFDKQGSYEAFLRRHLPRVPYRRALYAKISGPGMVMAYRSRQLAVDLRHECTHALLHAALPMVPLWLDEGLAEYFEVAPDKRASGNPHLKTVRWNARWGKPQAIGSLEPLGDLSQMGAREYRSAWAWVHYLLHGSPAGHAELRSFLAEIQAGAPPEPLSDRLAARIPKLDAEWSAHFRSWR